MVLTHSGSWSVERRGNRSGSERPVVNCACTQVFVIVIIIMTITALSSDPRMLNCSPSVGVTRPIPRRGESACRRGAPWIAHGSWWSPEQRPLIVLRATHLCCFDQSPSHDYRGHYYCISCCGGGLGSARHRGWREEENTPANQAPGIPLTHCAACRDRNSQ